MRPGRIEFKVSYVVDLDDEDMVQEAKDCVHEDVCNAVKMDEAYDAIKIVHDKDAKESDIPEFLKEKQ